MKKILFLLLCLVSSLTIMAQDAADIIVGNWKIDYNGKQSKVKIYKEGNGYRAQNYWVAEPTNKDGSTKLDEKNPDKTKRNIPVSKIVLIDKVVYDAKDKVWGDGKIYDPTSGKKYNVDIRVKDNNTLELHGKLGPFYKKIYWTKVKE